MIIILILIIILFLLILDNYINLDVTKYNIKNNKIDKNLKIMFLSDLHNRNILKRLLKIINNEKPDIIIFGGDMVNEYIKETKNFLDLIDNLNNKNIYYTFGNHELVMDDFNKYKKIIDNKNINVLNNKNTKLSKNINLYGFISDIKYYNRKEKIKLTKNYILNKIGKLDKNKFNILIAHNPLEFETYKDLDVDLVLTGHVHGGIIYIPVLGGLLSPEFKFFPKYYKGIYEKNNTKMIVSRGIGFSECIPFRILNRGQIIIINLNS